MSYKCGRPDCVGCTPPVVKPHTCTINTFPDCCYPDTPPVPIEVPCSLPDCDTPTKREGQPCDPCDSELGVGA